MTKFCKTLLSCIACMMLLCLLPSVATADSKEGGVGDLEVVFLMDVSESMNWVDPQNLSGTRMSLEAASQFVQYYPSEKNMFVKLITYQNLVYDFLGKVNVAEQQGRETFNQYMRYLVCTEEHPDGTLPAVPGKGNYNVCWRGQTNIQGALEAAQKSLSDSDATGKKAVILFTDGKIELRDGEDVEQSRRESCRIAKELRDAGVPVYSIGLDQGYLGKVDQTFLKALACDLCSLDKSCEACEDESKYVKIVGSPDDLSDVFADVYADLIGYAAVVDDPNSSDGTDGGVIAVDPEEESIRTYHVYSDAVKEVNINFSAQSETDKDGNIRMARIRTIRVEDPSGTQVAYVNVNDPTKNKIGDNITVVYSFSGCSATVKLREPVGGDWSVYLTGDDGILVEKRINLFDLQAKTTLDDRSTMYIGDPLVYRASIFNFEKKIDVTAPALFDQSIGARAFVTVRDASTGKKLGETEGTLNINGTCYDFSVIFDKPGVYEVITAVFHDEFELYSTSVVDVKGAELVMEGSTSAASGGVIDLSLYLKNSLTGERISKVPDYLKNRDIAIRLHDAEGMLLKETVVKAAELSNLRTEEIETPWFGSYQVLAEISDGDIKLQSKIFKATVAEPKLICEASPMGDEKIGVSVSVVNRVTGELLARTPGYLKGQDLVIQLYDPDGTFVSSKTFNDVILNDGQVLEVEVKKPGDYQVTAEIAHGSHKLKSASASVSLSVPRLVIEEATASSDDRIAFSLYIANPVSGEAMAKIPGYMAGLDVVVNGCDENGVLMFTESFPAADLDERKTVEFEAKGSDNYVFNAVIQSRDFELRSNTVQTKVDAPVLVLKADAAESVSDEITFSVYLANRQGEQITNIPGYLKGTQIDIKGGTGGTSLKAFLQTDDLQSVQKVSFSVLHPGEYTFTAVVAYGDTEIASEAAKVIVKAPLLVVEAAEGTSVKETVELSVYWVNPMTGTQMRNVPAYLSKYTVAVRGYSDDAKAVCESTLNAGELSDKKTVSLQVQWPGEYDFVAEISDYISVAPSKAAHVTVVEPGLVVDVPSSVPVGTVEIPVFFVNPNTRERLTAPLSYMEGLELNINFRTDDGNVKTETVSAAKLADGTYRHTYTASAAGNCTVTAHVIYNGKRIESAPGSVTFTPSVITASESAIPSVSHKAMSGVLDTEIDLAGMFEDSDSDKLFYTVRNEDGSPISGSIEDGSSVLKIHSESFAKATLTVVVTDGKGAEYLHEIRVTYASMRPAVIGKIVAAAVILAALLILGFVVWKKMVITVPFTVRISVPGSDQVEYTVPSLNANRIGRRTPIITLDRIIREGIAKRNYTSPEPSDAVQTFITTKCKNVTLYGHPFRRRVICLKWDKGSRTIKTAGQYRIPQTGGEIFIIRTGS